MKLRYKNQVQYVQLLFRRHQQLAKISSYLESDLAYFDHNHHKFQYYLHIKYAECQAL